MAQAAEASSVSVRTAYKWLARYRAGGEPALCDRSSAPGHCPCICPLSGVAARPGFLRAQVRETGQTMSLRTASTGPPNAARETPNLVNL